MQFKKGIICAATLTLLSVIAVMLTGCSDGRMLSDSELADVLSKSLGEKVEITEAPEGRSDGTYRMKCADGTEFTVRRMQMQHKYFGPRYYDYYCDYLSNWVHDHPELNTVLDEKGLFHEDFVMGTEVIASDFEELHTAIETACTLVEGNSNQVPAVSDILEEYELRFERPVVLVSCLKEPGKKPGMDYDFVISEFNFSDGTETIDYDEELEVFLAEREYVDDVRSGYIEASLPDELLEKYGPCYLKTQLMKTEYSLMRARNRGEDLSVGKTETLYYVSNYCNMYENETLNFPNIASWAECTGFEPYAADSEYYTLARGEEKVVFHFSESECYVERNGERVELRGKQDRSINSWGIYLTTGDLNKLFDTELKCDYINGTAEITNKKT